MCRKQAESPPGWSSGVEEVQVVIAVQHLLNSMPVVGRIWVRERKAIHIYHIHFNFREVKLSRIADSSNFFFYFRG